MANKTYNSEKQMDYNGLLLFHLDRIGLVCASNFLESVNSNHMALVSNPNTAGETSLEWCINHLRAMIPQDLEDKKFSDQMKALSKSINERENNRGNRTPSDNFKRMNIIVNLLHRRGLLIQQKVVGLTGKSDMDNSMDAVEEFWEE